MKTKVLILSSSQFGYLTDTFKYCEYAADKLDITYIGWDYGRPKIALPGVRIKYISRRGNLLMRNFRLLRAFHQEIQKGCDVVFANYLKGISIVKLLNPSVRFIIDVRTLSVHPERAIRFVYNCLLKAEISFFKEISAISRGVARKLGLKNYHLLPLGGECFSTKSKSFEKLSFLYVGTLENRNIIDCVKGFHGYLKNSDAKNPGPVFTIIGNSPNNELEEINEYINANGLQEQVKAVGSIPQTRLKPYFEDANIGVSYIPIRSYFKYQPPTKTFEYLISGLPVIATATFENEQVMGKHAGVLINDNPDSFKKGISELYQNRDYFDSDEIRKEYDAFSWKNIVSKYFLPLVNPN